MRACQYRVSTKRNENVRGVGSMSVDSKGLGDTVEKIAKALKVDTVVNKLTSVTGKEDCGCSKRKEFLNKKFPYSK